MQVKGKFYIRLNIASRKPYLWAMPIQNWTTEARNATFFDTLKDAKSEAVRASEYGPGKAYVLQATRDLPEREAA